MSEDQANLIIKLLESFKKDNHREHAELISHQKETNGNVKINTEYRLRFLGGFSVIKWLLGFVGVGNLVILFKLFI